MRRRAASSCFLLARWAEQGGVQQSGIAGPVQPPPRAAVLASTLRGGTGALHEAGDRQHFAVEVAGVQLLGPDSLVDRSQLGDGELLAQDGRGQR